MNKTINFHDVKDIVWFDKTINILKNKYTLVSAQDLESYYYHKKVLKNTCHITVDDGDISFYTIIYPILKKYDVPATLFVSPKVLAEHSNFWFQEIRGYSSEFKEWIANYLKLELEPLDKYSVVSILKNLKIYDIWNIIDSYKKEYNIEDKKPQNMNIDQLLEVENSGLVTIGAHTLQHPILHNETYNASEHEIIESINLLSNILNHEIKYFAYPNGQPNIDFSIREMNILKKVNCKLAFSTESKNFTLKDNPFSIPRYGLSYGNESFIKMKLLFGEYWEKIKKIKSNGENKSRSALISIMELS